MHKRAFATLARPEEIVACAQRRGMVGALDGAMSESGRVEDLRLVRGAGRYSDDVRQPDQAIGVFVRSPHAHARIRRTEIDSARMSPGVIAVLTAADMKAAGVGNVSVPPPLAGRDGRKLVVPLRPALAGDRVLHVGQPVTLVVAQSQDAAEDAAALVSIDYEPLPSVTNAKAALSPGAVQLWAEAPGNVAVDWPGPIPDEANEALVARILAEAPHRVRVEAVNQRLAGAPLEPRAATAEFDAETRRYILHCGSQGATALRNQLAAILGVEAAAIRVVTEDVGGAFGLKTPPYPEYLALMIAARNLGRPIRWTSSRSEAFMSDNQGRDTVVAAELAIDQTGRFLALKIDAVADMGAFISASGAQIATNNFSRCFPTVYAIPKVAIGVRCAFTNTVPTGPYRGAGRPEANYAMERLVDAAAHATGIDAIELRRRNLIRPEAMPYETAAGTIYDSGEFEAILDRALEVADYANFKARRAAAAATGRLRGIGISCFLEHAGAMGTESVDLSFLPGGTLALGLGVQSSGQGHETVFRDLLAERLDIAREAVVVREGDSDLDLKGMASVASRSAMTVSAAIVLAADLLIAKGRRLGTAAFEAGEEDVVYRQGAFEVVGTDRRTSLFALAGRAAAMQARGEIEESLDTRATAEVPQTFPNGCHIAEVEIDPDTGRVEVVGYVAVDDCGTVLNHALVEGQVVGGIAQGLGQAILEEVVYDAESGQILTGTFNDYAMPRAEQMPPIAAREHPVFCRTNPLGVKGVGEAGTTGALAAIMNAIADAIPNGRGADLRMPATPEKVWRACRGGFSD
jgi:aerobic carbon-monoxide dehydrogenase large subunit